MSKNNDLKEIIQKDRDFSLSELSVNDLSSVYGGDFENATDPNEFHWDPWHRRRPKEPKTGS